MSIGERIRIIRNYFRISQEELGGKIGRVSTYVSRTERGLTDVPDEIIKRICKCTKVRFEWLKFGSGEMLEKFRPRVNLDTVGERIRTIRKQNGLTQTEFARRIDSSLDMVGRSELGKTIPSDRWLQKVSEEFAVSMAWLLTGIDDGQDIVEQKMNRIDSFLRNNEVARIAVINAINSGDEGIWLRLEQLIREQKTEG